VAPTPSRSASWADRFRAAFRLDNYGVAIVLLAATYIVSVSADGSTAAAIVVFVQIGVVWFVLRTAGAHRRARLISFVLMVAAAGAAVLQIATGYGNSRPSPIIPFVSCILYLTALTATVRHIALRDVDLETALGAVAAYLCIGFFFAFAYRFLAIAQSGPFFGLQGDGPMRDVMFFSMTTLTTTGYGNLVPARNPGQSLAVLEMLMGQLFLIIIVGKVVAALPGRRRPTETPGSAES
jgi:hypothetical protein